MILPPGEMRAGAGAEVLILGAGCCGLVAALSAHALGREVLVVEREKRPGGSTALSSGFIPAAGTRAQAAQGIVDTAERFAEDISRKAGPSGDPAEARRVAGAIGPALDWLGGGHGVPFHVLDGFLYPGHGTHRMHAVPERSGAGLMARLLGAAEAAGVPVLTEARGMGLFADGAGRVHGMRVARPDGAVEDIACRALVLACSGFGGAAGLVREHIPEIADAVYFGHVGNQGDALAWGTALGAAARDLGAYQGHGNVAHPHGVLITWALLMEGGVQVNAAGERFSNELDGYSEQAVRVLRQPGGVAWTVFDERLRGLGLGFEDYRAAEAAGAVRTAGDVAALAAVMGVPAAGLAATLEEVAALARSGRADRFGRVFPGAGLAAPFHAVRVTGTLFHTQGGLMVDGEARVLRDDGTGLANLFAGGGAARGVSGAFVGGYLSGNGLLTAVAYGRLAGVAAAGV